MVLASGQDTAPSVSRPASVAFNSHRAPFVKNKAAAARNGYWSLSSIEVMSAWRLTFMPLIHGHVFKELHLDLIYMS